MKTYKAIFNSYNPVRGLFQKECTIEAESALQALKHCNEIEKRFYGSMFFVSLEEV